MRLQKYLASCGIASRRKCEELIIQGMVSVNDNIITELGTQVEDSDIVKYNGQVVKPKSDYVYYMLNKPAGYISAVSDDRNRKVVTELITDENKGRIFPVGRLDYETTGLLILTNDGDLTYSLTHPKNHVDKCYEAVIKGVLSDDSKQKLRDGIKIDGVMTYPAKLEILKQKGSYSVIRLTIHEGRNRQVRKMIEAVGSRVFELKRISIGNVQLPTNLEEGQYRALTDSELKYLLSLKNVNYHTETKQTASKPLNKENTTRNTYKANKGFNKYSNKNIKREGSKNISKAKNNKPRNNKK